MITLGAYEYNSNQSNLLGSGAFALVYKGRIKGKPDEPVAIKIMKKDQNMPKSKTLLSKEISVLKDLNHENIVHLYDHGVSTNGVYLVMEYCNGGDLSEYLLAKGTLPEDTIRLLLMQIGSAMDAINRKGFMHRDLKPGNILISHCRDCHQAVTDLPGYMLVFKLADFGFARFLQDGMMAVTMCGSPMYMAPEVLMCRKYDAVADIWSMGIIVYQCLTGKAPFYANNPEALKNIYEKTAYLKPKIPVSTSRLLRDLLLRMLVRKPSDRIDFEHFLGHPFLHQRHFEPTNNNSTLKPVPSSGLPNRNRRDNVSPETAIPAIGALGQGTGEGPYYLRSRNVSQPRDRTPQRNSPTQNALHEANSKRNATRKAESKQPPNRTMVYNQLPGYRNVGAHSPVDDQQMDEIDDEMSRTTVDEYFEDELDTSALPLDSTPAVVQPHPGVYTKLPYDTPKATPLSVAPNHPAPPVPCRRSSAHPTAQPNNYVVHPSPGHYAAGLLRPGNVERGEANLEDYVIVNPDGSEADRFTRGVPCPNTDRYPVSNVGRIVANPSAYLAGQSRLRHGESPPLPDVTAIGGAPTVPTPTRAFSPTPSKIPGVRDNTSVPTRFSSRPPSFPAAIGHVPAAVTNEPTQGYPTSAEIQMVNDQVRRRPQSGAGVLEYGAGNLPNGLSSGALWPATELSDEQVMDPEHNEEIKTITMVLELCELLSELAERRASAFTDCTVTTNSPAPPTHQNSGDSSTAEHSNEQAPNNPNKDSEQKSDDSGAADNSTGPTTELRFISEAQRIVEQIVLYRRILYYLEYVFVQVKKAFHQRRLKSTATARRRLTDCNALYHRCYIRLRQLARQSRRDDLIEPVGRLLANITANRLIFQYALVQCQAAEMDEYVGDIAQSLQRYKAGITLIHGLRQHAKSVGDKSLLADCMRLLHDRYKSLRAAAAGCIGRTGAFTTEYESSPASNRSPTPQQPLGPMNPLDPGLGESPTPAEYALTGASPFPSSPMR